MQRQLCSVTDHITPTAHFCVPVHSSVWRTSVDYFIVWPRESLANLMEIGENGWALQSNCPNTKCVLPANAGRFRRWCIPLLVVRMAPCFVWTAFILNAQKYGYTLFSLMFHAQPATAATMWTSEWGLKGTMVAKVARLVKWLVVD